MVNKILLIFPILTSAFSSCSSESNESKKKEYTVDKGVNFNGLVFYVNKIQVTQELEREDGNKYKTENYYVCLITTTQNNTQKTQTIEREMFIYHTGQYSYIPADINIVFSNCLYLSRDIDPGLKKDLWIIFETPNGFTDSDYLEIKPYKNYDYSYDFTFSKAE